MINLLELRVRARYRLDRLRGVDFAAVGAEPGDYGFGPTVSPSLTSAIAALGITPADSIIDIGCGKGTAMRQLLAFPFGTVAGLELSETLAAIARRNFQRIRAGRRTQIIVGDAATFDGLDPFSHVYLYNPFPAPTFAAFTAQLEASVRRAPRPVTVLYAFPRFGNLLDDTSLFESPIAVPGPHGKGINIYCHRP